jgi:DNA-binding protein H-NS
MPQLQEVFDRIQGANKKRRDLVSMYKEALHANKEYEDLNEKIATLRAKKKQIENATIEDFGKEFEQIESLKVDTKSDAELLTDIAMTQYTKGETVELKDEYENTYEPKFSVRFKKKQ